MIGTAVYKDEINKLEAEVVYNPRDPVGYIESWKSWWNAK